MKKIISILLSVTILLTCGISVIAYELPQSQTNVHLYMDWKTITDKNSDQWKLQNSGYVSTDENGIRYCLDSQGQKYYLVALAARYGTDIGSAYEITLDNGIIFRVMLGDCKAPADTPNSYGRDCYNFITKSSAINILEFIVDTSYLPSKVINWGTLTAIEDFNGNITNIEYLGRPWSS